MPLVIIDRTSEKGGMAVERISAAEWRKLQTLTEWERQNPKVWEQIRTFVYRRDLNKKPPKHPTKRYPADVRLLKKKQRPKKKKMWFE